MAAHIIFLTISILLIIGVHHLIELLVRTEKAFLVTIPLSKRTSSPLPPSPPLPPFFSRQLGAAISSRQFADGTFAMKKKRRRPVSNLRPFRKSVQSRTLFPKTTVPWSFFSLYIKQPRLMRPFCFFDHSKTEICGHFVRFSNGPISLDRFIQKKTFFIYKTTLAKTI